MIKKIVYLIIFILVFQVSLIFGEKSLAFLNVRLHPSQALDTFDVIFVGELVSVKKINTFEEPAINLAGVFNTKVTILVKNKVIESFKGVNIDETIKYRVIIDESTFDGYEDGDTNINDLSLFDGLQFLAKSKEGYYITNPVYVVQSFDDSKDSDDIAKDLRKISNESGLYTELNSPKSPNIFMPIVIFSALLLLLVSIGYFGYSKFRSKPTNNL